MKKSTIFLFLVFCLLTSCEKEKEIPVCCIPEPPKPELTSVTYAVTFSFDWNKVDFPVDYPSGPHFSSLVGWVHQKDNTYFDEGTTSSPGIESMAETGATSILVNELQTLINQGKGLKTYTGSGLGGGVGTISIDIEVSADFPSVTLATMLAPSPDWFVACIDVLLLNDGGSFIETKTIIGHVYDAGTDSGSSYSSPNNDTNPKMRIAKITESPLGDGTQVNPKLCTITFVKK